MGTSLAELKPAKQHIALHLGCGRNLWKGFINIDRANNAFGVTPDVDCDIRRLPFPDNYADEIHAIHVIEHFYVWEVPDILFEWRRVLKPKSYLVLEMPDLKKVLELFVKGNAGFAKTWCALYGDPNWKDKSMCHRWSYTFKMLKRMLELVGYDRIEEKAPIFHMPERDMRIIARKARNVPCMDADGKMSVKIIPDEEII